MKKRSSSPQVDGVLDGLKDDILLRSGDSEADADEEDHGGDGVAMSPGGSCNALMKKTI